MYRILVSRKVLRSISKMSESIQMKLANLVEDLRDKGPLQTGWPNFSRIGKMSITAIFHGNGWPVGTGKKGQ